jgi:protein-disulfide isomerase
MHPNALPAAEAAEAARAQGKFWEMHDLLFANQQALSPANYAAWAKQLRLDSSKFQAAVDSHSYRARIDEDSQLGNSVGAVGTPTLFVNCRPVVGAKPFEQLQPVIDQERQRAEVALKAGAKLDAGLYERLCADNVKAAAAPAASPRALAVLALRSDDPVRGNQQAAVTIVEFSDFECPFCGRVEPTLAQVQQAYGSKVRLVWKHQPLSIHANALPAALAAEAAREQGKFWEMHDMIFSNQTALSDVAYERWATELGLDLTQFRASILSRRNLTRIQEDSVEGSKLGAGGTPTFFVNGEKLVGAQPFEQFKTVIDRQLLAQAKLH